MILFGSLERQNVPSHCSGEQVVRYLVTLERLVGQRSSSYGIDEAIERVLDLDADI